MNVEELIRKAREEDSTSLDLSYYSLEKIPDGLLELKSLRELNLSGNFLTEMSLSGLDNLTTLDLSNNQGQLTKLILSGLTNLTTLKLWNTQIAKLTLSGLTSLLSLDLCRNQITEVNLNGLTSLTKLDLWTNQITEVSLNGLTSLTSLALSNNQITDLTPLSGLTNLNTLTLSNNQITDLTSLSGLTNLNTLDLSRNQITDLTPLSELTKLNTLTLSNNQITDLTSLSGLTKLNTLGLSRNQITDLTPLSELTSLTTLKLSGAQVTELTLSGLNSLTSLDLGEAHLTKLTLSGLKSLTSLDLSDTQITELTLNGLNSLTSLDLNNTQITELTLNGLTSLTSLSLSGTKVTDLPPLSELNSLTTLDLSFTQITDPTPLSGLNSLTSLSLNGTKVTDLTPLSGLNSLASLSLSGTKVTDLTPLSGLNSLASLSLSGTRVTDLTPLSGLNSLTSLNLRGTQVTDLTPLSELNSLTSLDLRFTQITDPTPLSGLNSLSRLILQGNLLAYSEEPRWLEVLEGEALQQFLQKCIRRRVVETFSSLSIEQQKKVFAAFPEADLNWEASSEDLATKLIAWAEESGLDLESLVVRAHQIDPSLGLLQKALPGVSRLDAALKFAVHLPEGSSQETDPETASQKIPVLIELADESCELDDLRGFEQLTQLGPMIGGTADQATLQLLERDSRVLFVEASPFPLDPEECANSVPAVRACPQVHNHRNERGDQALVAIIDKGIDVLHQAFRDEEGKSRILAVWDQRDDTGSAPDMGSKNKPFGTLHTGEDLNRYVETGQLPDTLVPTDNCHGTAVASIAAGRGCGSFFGGVAPEAKIVVVIPRISRGEGQEGLGDSVALVAALDFIKRQATEYQLPVVVNVSQGDQLGAHDGTSLLERSFDFFSGNGVARGRVVVKSAGNDQQKNWHAQTSMTEKTKRILKWKARAPKESEEKRSRDLIDLWFAPGAELQFVLRNPSGEESESVSPSSSVCGTFPTGNKYNLTYHRFDARNGHSRLLVKVTNGDRDTIEGGNWELEISALKVANAVQIDAWIGLSSEPWSRFQTMPTHLGTLSIPGTAKHVISVGAVQVIECLEGELITAPAEFTSCGETRDGRQKPDVAAPGVGIEAAQAGTDSITHPLAGTSYAAPHVTGAVALLLSCLHKSESVSQQNTQQILQALIVSSQGYNGNWETDQGYGVLDAENLLASFLNAVVAPTNPTPVST